MTHFDDRVEHHSEKPAGVSVRVETTDEVRVTTPEKVCGMGHRMKRKEDPRFLQGRGRYVDDVKLPGMLYMDIVRSPYAHAKILSIDASEALATEGVLAVITGEDLKAAGNLHWMPTLMSDTQMVLPIDKVVYAAQEVAAVIATERYIAADAIEKVSVDYEPLEEVVDPFEAMKDEVIIRDDKEEKTNHIWHWEAGDAEAADRVFAGAAHTVEQQMHLPRTHVSSIETCGMVANYDKVREHMQIYMTSKAPHAHCTMFALVSGLPEHKIQIISPDIGGGFGGKVPVYPGYVCCAVASLVTGKSVKWIEDRSENLQADSFARDYHITARMAADGDGRITGLQVRTVADHGCADAAANPSKFPAGLYSIGTGSYDMQAAHFAVDGVYTNKPPGGVAYRCSFRVAEAVHMIERMADVLAHDLGEDPKDFRLKNFIRPDQFPYRSPTGWEYDSGNYRSALEKAMEMIDYRALRRGHRLLRPAQPHLPLRQLHLRGRRRQGHRRGPRAAFRGGRRLRQHHQPGGGRGPDRRRPDHGAGAGLVRGDRLRRERPEPVGHLRRLPAADGGGVAEVGARQDHHPVAPITPSPHHPLGAKGVGESPTVGAPPAIANAVVDALWHLGVRHIDIPITPEKVWRALREAGVGD